MIRYWLTTHWPQWETDSSPHHRNIYLQEHTEDAGREIDSGDKVLIYESLGGRTPLEIFADGTSRPIPLRRGRGGIVTVADVTGRLTRRAPAESIQQYTDGSTMNWCWIAATARHVSNGFVPLAEVNRVLGYKAGSVLRGFGTLNSGLKEITKEQYDELLTAFAENASPDAPAPGGQPPPPGRWREGGGEGPEHLMLKRYVAANPSIVLDEKGVTTVKIEYPFPSGDQADIVLRDSARRFIGVEIELEQNDRQLEGLLQAVKYRHMLAVMEGVTFEECGSLLAAYRLGSRIKALCARYDVAYVEVDRKIVEKWAASNSE